MPGSTLIADAVQEGRSPWAGYVGKKIAQEDFTLTDDDIMKDGVATFRFDAEGVSQRRTPLIDRGILKGFLYNVYYARKAGRESTGNARRRGGVIPKSFARPPEPSISNLRLGGGDSSLDKMVRETRDGIYVTSTVGSWLSNPVRGQLNATISGGYGIRNGRIMNSIKGATLQADFAKIINGGIKMVGRDVDNSSSVYSPTVLVQDVAVTSK